MKNSPQLPPLNGSVRRDSHLSKLHALLNSSTKAPALFPVSQSDVLQSHRKLRKPAAVSKRISGDMISVILCGLALAMAAAALMHENRLAPRERQILQELRR